MFKHQKGRAWAALIMCRHRCHIQCPVCLRLEVQKNKKKAWISIGLQLSGVLLKWLDHWTRLPAIVLTPHALETQTAHELAIMIVVFSELQEHEASKQ